MPKNKGKGGKNRRRGKNENEGFKRELVFKEDGQEYAQVTKMLGNGCEERVSPKSILTQKYVQLIGLTSYFCMSVLCHICVNYNQNQGVAR